MLLRWVHALVLTRSLRTARRDIGDRDADEALSARERTGTRVPGQDTRIDVDRDQSPTAIERGVDEVFMHDGFALGSGVGIAEVLLHADLATRCRRRNHVDSPAAAYRCRRERGHVVPRAGIAGDVGCGRADRYRCPPMDPDALDQRSLARPSDAHVGLDVGGRVGELSRLRDEPGAQMRVTGDEIRTSESLERTETQRVIGRVVRKSLGELASEAAPQAYAGQDIERRARRSAWSPTIVDVEGSISIVTCNSSTVSDTPLASVRRSRPRTSASVRPDKPSGNETSTFHVRRTETRGGRGVVGSGLCGPGGGCMSPSWSVHA